MPLRRKHQEAWAAYLAVPVEETNSIGMKMVLIPPGVFQMGSTDAQVEAAIKIAERDNDAWRSSRIRDAERPQHSVELTKPFQMSATEVTIGQFRKFVERSKYVTLAEKTGGDSDSTDPSKPGIKTHFWSAPGYPVGDDAPVSQVSWLDAAAFCNWLCEQETLPLSYREYPRDGSASFPERTAYRLPTEAQWEFACRAGTTTQYWFGDDPEELAAYGWYVKNSGGAAHAVARKPANPFGLYDMHGNVEEWVPADWLDDKYYNAFPAKDPNGPAAGSRRAVRGGRWLNLASICRSAAASRFPQPGAPPQPFGISGCPWRLSLHPPKRCILVLGNAFNTRAWFRIVRSFNCGGLKPCGSAPRRRRERRGEILCRMKSYSRIRAMR